MTLAILPFLSIEGNLFFLVGGSLSQESTKRASAIFQASKRIELVLAIANPAVLL